MGRHYTLELAITDDAPAPEKLLGLLVPMPPTTAHQRLLGFEIDGRPPALRLLDASGRQGAAWLPAGARPAAPRVTMTLGDSGQPVAAHFEAAAGAIGADADALARTLGLSQLPTAAERLDEIVAHLAAKFRYLSGHTNDAPLTCDVLTGNCQSINDALMQLAMLAGVPCAYYIGYFFPEAPALVADDWHCWVSTLADGEVQDWDIAHHLKRGLAPVRPGLNPVPGLRFAMGVGRDLAFELNGTTVRLPHFCEPRWVLQGGATRRCRVSVEARPLRKPAAQPRAFA